MDILTQLIMRVKNSFKPKTVQNLIEPEKHPISPFASQMISLETYFKQNSENNLLFEPEFIAARNINQYALKDNLTKDDLMKIVEIFNKTNESKHYNGSGWMDFRLHIQRLIEAQKCTYKLLPNLNIQVI